MRKGGGGAGGMEIACNFKGPTKNRKKERRKKKKKHLKTWPTVKSLIGEDLGLDLGIYLLGLRVYLLF